MELSGVLADGMAGLGEVAAVVEVRGVGVVVALAADGEDVALGAGAAEAEGGARLHGIVGVGLPRAGGDMAGLGGIINPDRLAAG